MNSSKRSPPRHFPYKHPTFGTIKNPKSDKHWKETVYYLWWNYLKRNQEYIKTCKSSGKKHLTELYKDFGDVRGDDFKAWWKENDRGVKLFAEPSVDEIVRVLKAGEVAKDEALTISFPLNLPKKHLEHQFKKLLAIHHKGKRGHQLAKRSQAKYRFKGQPKIHALEKALEVYDYKEKNPELSLWEIGNKLNLNNKQKIKNDDDDLDKKNILGSTTSRYLRRAKKSIKNAGNKVFP